jgi:hypothetical protein
MPSALTKLEVWNLAIDIIKDTALQTSDLGTAATARWLERNWSHAVRTTLRSYPWNFAKELRSLSQDAVDPEHTWSKRYQLPPNWVRVLPFRRNGDRVGRPIPHEVVGNYIYTDESAPLRVPLIMDKSEEVSSWDPLFTEIIRCKLALGMANKFTSKNKFIELASQMLTTAQQQAEQIETFEGSAEPAEQFDILRVRGGEYDFHDGFAGRGTYHGGY